MAAVVTVLQVNRQAGACTQFHNGWRHNRQTETVFQRSHHHAGQLTGNRSRIAARSSTFAPVFQNDKAQSHVLAGTAKTKAGNGNNVLDLRYRFRQLSDLSQSCIGTLFGRAGRQLYAQHQVTLVFSRQEGSRQTHKQEYAHNSQTDIDNHHAQSLAQDFGYPAFVAVCPVVEFLVKPTEETFFLFVMTILNRLEHGGTQCRSQRQSKECGEADRCHHGQGKLFVNVTGCTAKHCQRHKYGHQHGSNTDHRAGNLTHRFFGCSLRRQTFTRHNTLNVFNDHNRVIDHNTDHQYHRKHGQYVNRHTHV